jgi:NifU-like protein involved in Fe-S cluster formation
MEPMERDALDYSAEVRQRFERAPRHGPLLAAPAERLHGAAGEVKSGVRVEFEARTREGRIVECRFRAYGCPHVIAAASWVAEHAEGRSVFDVDWVDPRRLAEFLEAPPHKLGSLLVVEDAFRACLAEARRAGA